MIIICPTIYVAPHIVDASFTELKTLNFCTFTQSFTKPQIIPGKRSILFLVKFYKYIPERF